MSLKLVTLTVLAISAMAMCYPAPEEEADKHVKQFATMLNDFQSTMTKFASDFAESDSFKQLKELGDHFTSKGKELQEKLSETLQNMAKKTETK